MSCKDSDLIFEAYKESKQTFYNGQQVRFDMNDINVHEFPGMEEIVNYDGRIATIDCLQTATCEGHRDYEYYDITFADGKEFSGISGYQLSPVKRYINGIEDQLCRKCGKIINLIDDGVSVPLKELSQHGIDKNSICKCR